MRQYYNSYHLEVAFEAILQMPNQAVIDYVRSEIAQAIARDIIDNQNIPVTSTKSIQSQTVDNQIGFYLLSREQMQEVARQIANKALAGVKYDV